MENETVVAAPSAEQPSLEIPRSGTPEYADWRITGKLPEKKSEPKPAETASADAAKEQTTEPAGAEPAKQQETRRKPDAEHRIKQLTDELKQVRTELDEVRRPKPTQAEPSPARPQVEQPTRPKPTLETKNDDGILKYGTYEDYIEDLADWKAEQRWVANQREQAARQQAAQLQSKVDDARARYGDQFDGVLAPTVNRIQSKADAATGLTSYGDQPVSTAVKAMLNDSDVLPDLIFTLGSDAEGLASFLKMAPGKQIRYIAALEAGIQAELSKPARQPDGKFAAQTEPPAKRGPESAPEPPIEIGHRGGGSMDESQRALQAAERGDVNAFRSWKQAEDRKALARRRGA